MSHLDPLPPSPTDSALECSIAAVDTVYQRIERDQAAFQASAAGQGLSLRCPPGCGSCCEPFVPDIVPAEASYAAAWMLGEARDLVREVLSWRSGGPPSTPPCPFLRVSEAGSSCAIYPARFLICRLFGFSGVRDKLGRAVFRPCPSMPLETLLEAEPPVMADYAAELIALSPSGPGERSSVLEALPSALIRIGLARSLAAREQDRAYCEQDERERY
jgi:Fe-S-cluster containining protein